MLLEPQIFFAVADDNFCLPNLFHRIFNAVAKVVKCNFSPYRYWYLQYPVEVYGFALNYTIVLGNAV